MILDALIIGGGPAGATAAQLLSQAGWSVALVEKKSFPRRKVCGEFISATTIPLLKALGLFDRFCHHRGPAIKRVGLFAHQYKISAPMPMTTPSNNPWGHALERSFLDTWLLHEAQHYGTQIWQPWSATELIDKGTAYHCRIQSEKETHTLSARMVIMAQGSWERAIIKAVQRRHHPSDLLAFKAHFTGHALEEDLMPLFSFPGGYGGLVQTHQHRLSLSCCIRRDQLECIRTGKTNFSAGEAVLNHITSTCLGVREVLSDAVRQDSWLSTGPLQPGIRHCYREGLFYVGNIAGEAHPVIAEGISMAIQSAWVLSNLLIKNSAQTRSRQDLKSIGKIYTQQWRAQFKNRIQVAALLAHITMRPYLMKLGLPLIQQFPRILTCGASLSGKATELFP